MGNEVSALGEPLAKNAREAEICDNDFVVLFIIYFERMHRLEKAVYTSAKRGRNRPVGSPPPSSAIQPAGSTEIPAPENRIAAMMHCSRRSQSPQRPTLATFSAPAALFALSASCSDFELVGNGASELRALPDSPEGLGGVAVRPKTPPRLRLPPNPGPARPAASRSEILIEPSRTEIVASPITVGRRSLDRQFPTHLFEGKERPKTSAIELGSTGDEHDPTAKDAELAAELFAALNPRGDMMEEARKEAKRTRSAEREAMEREAEQKRVAAEREAEQKRVAAENKQASERKRAQLALNDGVPAGYSEIFHSAIAAWRNGGNLPISLSAVPSQNRIFVPPSPAKKSGAMTPVPAGPGSAIQPVTAGPSAPPSITAHLFRAFEFSGPFSLVAIKALWAKKAWNFESPQAQAAPAAIKVLRTLVGHLAALNINPTDAKTAKNLAEELHAFDGGASHFKSVASGKLCIELESLLENCEGADRITFSTQLETFRAYLFSLCAEAGQWP